MSQSQNSSGVYVISGANRGIGLELTRIALKRGYLVVTGVRSPEKAQELKELQEDHPGRLRIEKLDTASDEGVEHFAKQIDLPAVDVLINNAGVYMDENDSLEGVSSQTLLDSYNINTVGTFRLTKSLLSKLRNAPSPVVANISSQMGSIENNSSGGSYAYRTSKAALNMLTKSLSIDEPKIRALTLHPGWVRTRMGGPGATVAPFKSAEGLLNIIEKATAEDSGKFFNYQGEELPW